MLLTPWVTRLMLANAAVFLVTLGLGTIPGPLVLVPALVWRQPWTPLTYMFLHAGFGHIFFNMLTLFFFGPRVEMQLGGTRFVRLYLISGFAGAGLSILTPFAPIVGASGAIFGVMYAFAHFWPRAPIYIWGVIPIEARILVAVWTAFAVFGGLGFGGGGVAHFAHLGGFLGAFIYLRFAAFRVAAKRARATRASGLSGASGQTHRLDRWKRIRGEDLHPLNREELNRILDKISASGIDSLNQSERNFLDRFSTTH